MIWFFIIEERPMISKYMAGEGLLDLIAYARYQKDNPLYLQVRREEEKLKQGSRVLSSLMF